MDNTQKEKWKEYRLLFQLGGIAPFITIFLYFSEFLFIPWDRYPAHSMEWLELFHTSKLQGLFLLNSLDILSIGILGVMFVALFFALKKGHLSLMSIALPTSLVGIAVFIVPRSLLLSLGTLADQYFSTADSLVQERIHTAAHLLTVLGIPTFQTAGFLIIGLASLMISLVILRSKVLPEIIGYLGIAGFLLNLADHLVLLLGPWHTSLFMILGGLFWVLWCVIIGFSLLRMARQLTETE